MSKIKSIQKSTRKPWTEAEINFLKVNYAKMTALEISERLGRPLQAIYGRVKRLKIRKARPCNYVKKVLSSSPAKISEKKINVASMSSVDFKEHVGQPLLSILILMNSISILLSLSALLLHFFH